MDKQEFLNICDTVLKEMGFIKKRGYYYLTNGSDIAGAIFLQRSYYGPVYYVNCTLTLAGYNPAFPYPKRYESDIHGRLPFPLHQILPYALETKLGYSFDLERNTAEELAEYLQSGIAQWMLPAMEGGKQYLLDHWKAYNDFHGHEAVYAALTEWAKTGMMPCKPIEQR